MVALDVQGHQGFRPFLNILAVDNPGIAVGRDGYRLDALGKGHPGNTGGEDHAALVLILIDKAGMPGGFLLASPGVGQEFLKAPAAIGGTVAEGGIRQGYGMAHVAVVILDDPVPLDPLAQLRHSVGRPGGGPEDGMEPGSAMLLCKAVNTAHIHGKGHGVIGVGNRGKEIKYFPYFLSKREYSKEKYIKI